MHPIDSLSSDWADALFETAPVPMVVVAPDHRFARCNAAYCDLVGYSRGELLQRNWQSITHPDDLAGDQSGADATRQDRSHPTYRIEKRYLTKRGDVVWVHLHVRGIWGDDRFQCYFVTALRHSLTRCEDCPEHKSMPSKPKTESIAEWAKRNPKDAALMVFAGAAFLGRDAVLDLVKVLVK